MKLLFDIGGTNIRIGFSLDGKTLSQTKIIPTPRDFDQGIQDLKQVTDELSGGQKIEGVAGGIAGVLDKDRLGLAKSAHVSGWAGKPLKKALEEAFATSVKLENDTAIEGLGEANFGAGAGKGIVGFITIGTGVGGVRIVGGQIDKNSLGFEPGHQIIIPDGNDCQCEGKGHLESYVGGSYLQNLYGKKGEEITDPQTWDQISKFLSIGLYNTIVHWSPDIIVLGGSVTKSIPLDNLKNHLAEIMHVYPESPEIVKATLGDQAGLYGALHLMLK